MAELEERMREVVVLPPNEAVSRAWARFKSARGPTLTDNDAWIAACAEAYGCTLVTEDAAFKRFPVLDVISRQV